MPTQYFNFLQLSGTETAGYNSINALITNIDTRIRERVAVPGMVILWDGVAVPSGWEALTANTAPTLTQMNTALGTPPNNMLWIRKT